MQRPRDINIRTRLTCVCSAVLACALTLSSFANSPQRNESDVRAAVVYRLLQLSTWSGFENSDVQVCELGNGVHSNALRALEKRRLGKASQINISQRSSKDLNNCQVVIVGPEREKLISTQNPNIFVICNDCEENKDLAVIDVCLRDERVRYKINQSIAANMGIRFNSNAFRYEYRDCGGAK